VRAGADPDPRIVPFRGAYLRLRAEKSHLVRGLIYPVPDPELPFLGVHLSRHLDGNVSLGPSALLAPLRPARTLAWPGTWRMARRWWRTGARELARAASSRRFAREAAGYVPELEPGDFSPWYAGVRAQAVARDGTLVDDFVLSVTPRALHVRNAPSPAATSSLALARLIADRVDSLGPA
jgi:2-hydroxyglutarate dehydrogenase